MYDDQQPPEPTNAEIFAAQHQTQRMLRALAGHLGMNALMLDIEPASDHDLNSEWGNPQIKFTPRNWTGEPVEGRHLSDLQPATLRALAADFARLARYYDEQGQKDGKGRPKSHYARKDAGRALGWALRLEAQGHRGPARPAAQVRPRPEPAPSAPDEGYQGSDDDIPF